MSLQLGRAVSNYLIEMVTKNFHCHCTAATCSVYGPEPSGTRAPSVASSPQMTMIKNAFALAGGEGGGGGKGEGGAERGREIGGSGRWMMNSKHKTHSRHGRRTRTPTPHAVTRSLTHSWLPYLSPLPDSLVFVWPRCGRLLPEKTSLLVI